MTRSQPSPQGTGKSDEQVNTPAPDTTPVLTPTIRILDSQAANNQHARSQSQGSNHHSIYAPPAGNGTSTRRSTLSSLGSPTNTIVTINPSNTPSPSRSSFLGSTASAGAAPVLNDSLSISPPMSPQSGSPTESYLSPPEDDPLRTAKSPSSPDSTSSLNSNLRTGPTASNSIMRAQQHVSQGSVSRQGSVKRSLAAATEGRLRSFDLGRSRSNGSMDSNIRTPNPLKRQPSPTSSVHSSASRLSEMAQKLSDYFLPHPSAGSRRRSIMDWATSQSSQRPSVNASSTDLGSSVPGSSVPVSSSSSSAIASSATAAAATISGSTSALCSGTSTPVVKETHHVHVEYDPITHKRIINTYEILKDLGSGEHGKVKLARDIDTGQYVAIKIVDRRQKCGLGKLSRNSSTQEDKIRREIAIMKKCDHPHIVKLIEVLDSDASRKIYMILEYLEKGEIHWQRQDDSTNQNPEPLLTLDKTRRVFRDVISGLEYLHHQGIVHRDIKPSNLLVGGDNSVKISDFGVSYAANLDSNQDSNERELAKTAGTPAFLAPELCSMDNDGSIKVTHKIDIWALGVTLYCLLFGELPFDGDTEFQLFDAINTKPPKEPNMGTWRVAQPIPPHDLEVVEDLLAKLLEKNPEKRIDIDGIKKHPFFLEGLTRAQTVEYCSNWNNDMKIDVTNKEVNEAVIGIGTRIKKKIQEVIFGKQKIHKHRLDKLEPSRSYLLSEVGGNFVPNSPMSSSTTALSTENCKGKIGPSHLRDTLYSGDATLSDLGSIGSEPQTLYRAPSPKDSSMPSRSSPLAIASVRSDAILKDHCSDLDDNDGDNADEEYCKQYFGDRNAASSQPRNSYSPSFASLNSYYDETYLKYGDHLSRAPSRGNRTRDSSVGSTRGPCPTGFTPLDSTSMHMANSGISVPVDLEQTDMDPLSPTVSYSYRGPLPTPDEHTAVNPEPRSFNRSAIYGRKFTPNAASSYDSDGSSGSCSSTSASDTDEEDTDSEGDELLLTINPRRRPHAKSRASEKKSVVEYDVPEGLMTSDEVERERLTDEQINTSQSIPSKSSS